MNIEVRKLTADLLGDWLTFFDHTVSCDDNEWAGCYCMSPHWSTELHSEKEWEYSEAGAVRNRRYAEEYIKKGIMQGYLAYSEGKAVGWCNVNDKNIYDSIFFKLPWTESEKGKKIKAIACFFIAPDFRGKGVATRILETLCTDAANEGYEYVEAYPFIHDDYEALTGPVAMYEKNGFTALDEENELAIIFRKYF